MKLSWLKTESIHRHMWNSEAYVNAGSWQESNI